MTAAERSMPVTEDRPLSVLWLIKGLGAGGAERLLVLQARRRDRSRFAPTVAYLLPHKSDLAEALRVEGVESHCLGARSRADLRWIFALRRLLCARRFDVVHIHSPLAAIGCRLILRTMPARQRPRVVVTEHNVWESHARLTRVADRATEGVEETHIAVSSAALASMPPALQRRTRVVRHGVDTAEVEAAAGARNEMRTSLQVAPDEVLIGTVANLRWTKGYPDLMRAARIVLDETTNVRFVVVGRGPLEDELRSLHATLDLGDRFRLLGHHPDAPSVMSSFDVFCLASRQEGLPIAVMEALVLGLPIVATRVGGIEELLTDGREARLVPPRSPAQLAGAILTVARRIDEKRDGSACMRARCDREHRSHRPRDRRHLPEGRSRVKVGDVTIRRMDADDRSAVLAPMAASHGGAADDDNASYFEWKHERNPAGPSPSWVAVDDGRVAGFRTFLQWRFQHPDGRTRRAVRAVDTATAPEAQGRGIFRRLMLTALEELRDAGIDFIFNTPNDKSRPGYVKMGGSQLGRPRVASARGALRMLRAHVPADRWSIPVDAGISIDEMLSEPRIRAAVEGGARATHIRTEHTIPFLRWRYGYEHLHYRAYRSTATRGVASSSSAYGGAEPTVCDVIGGQRVPLREVLPEVIRQTNAHYAIVSGGLDARGLILPLPAQGPIVTFRPLADDVVPNLVDFGLTLGDVEAL